jgi:hypothetical protein
MPKPYEKNSIALSDFKKKKVMVIDQLADLLDCSIPTVRRRLKKWRTYTSYNYNGRYYTLPDIPQFDEYGLWKYKSILFSKHGNLRQVVIHSIQHSPAGLTAREAEETLQVSLGSFMPCFRNIADLRREKIAGRYVYFSSNEATYTKQKKKRQEDEARSRLRNMPTDTQTVIILVERIKHPEWSVEQLCVSLNKKGHRIKGEIMRNLFERHRLLKKTMDTQQ